MTQQTMYDEPEVQKLWEQWSEAQAEWMRLNDEVRTLDERSLSGPVELDELLASGEVNDRMHAAYERYQELDRRYVAARNDYFRRRYGH